MAINDTEILEIISDMEDFVAENWLAFKFHMNVKGFTDDDVENMGKILTDYLEEEGYR